MNHFAKLNWVVLCKPPGQVWFEPIAAFNSPNVADQYADACRKVHPDDWQYLVERVGANGKRSKDQNKGRYR